MLISTPNINEARKLIQNSKEKPILVRAQNEQFNRKIVEYGKFDVLLSIEKTSPGKDSLRQYDSGFNQVLAKLAAKNKIALGIDLEEIRKMANAKQKAIRLGRIIQNIKLCRKAKCKMQLVNYKDKKDAFDLLISLGASTEQAKEATYF
jgi:RNase P/RNase MRP subunit p30